MKRGFQNERIKRVVDSELIQYRNADSVQSNRESSGFSPSSTLEILSVQGSFFFFSILWSLLRSG